MDEYYMENDLRDTWEDDDHDIEEVVNGFLTFIRKKIKEEEPEPDPDDEED